VMSEGVRRRKNEAWVVAGSENGRVVIWEMGSRRVVQVLEDHTSPVVALAVSRYASPRSLLFLIRDRYIQMGESSLLGVWSLRRRSIYGEMIRRTQSG
jgi:hypothetical protein